MIFTRVKLIIVAGGPPPLTDAMTAPMYSELQETVLAILPMCTGPVSAVASCIVVCHTWWALRGRRPHQQQRPSYHRLMFGMAFVDVFNSINLALSSTMVPHGTPGYRLPWGTPHRVTSPVFSSWWVCPVRCTRPVWRSIS
jgi:hypothetical protein